MEKGREHSENELIAFSKWIKNLCENGKVSDISPQVVKGVLESCGANFEALSDIERGSLRKYSNKGKGPGLKTVWGEEKVDTFKSWVIQEYIPFVEKELAGKCIPCGIVKPKPLIP